MASLAEMEHELIVERTRAGLDVGLFQSTSLMTLFFAMALSDNLIRSNHFTSCGHAIR